MNTKRELDAALDQYEAFLSKSQAPGAAFWAEQLRTARRELGHAPWKLAARLLSFYGGMGSLNDIVTEPGEETERDRALGERLYEVCRQTLNRRHNA